MPRFQNIPGGVFDTETEKRWRLGSDVNRTQPAAETEVDGMGSGYAMPSFEDLKELNKASVADMNSCNLQPFVGKRIWSDTSCPNLGGNACQSIELGDGGNDDCTLKTVSTNLRAFGQK